MNIGTDFVFAPQANSSFLLNTITLWHVLRQSVLGQCLTFKYVFFCDFNVFVVSDIAKTKVNSKSIRLTVSVKDIYDGI